MWTVNLSGESDKALGTSQRRQAHRVLSVILDFALRSGRIQRNPVRFDAEGKVGYLRKSRAKSAHHYVTPERLKIVTTACGPYETLILLMGTTGLRWGDATILTVGDIEVARRRIKITKAHVDHDGRIKVDTDLLFVRTKQEPLRNSNFYNRVWSKARIQAGEPELRIHDLRFTAASLAIQSGANVKAVQNMLGHKSAEMILDLYSGLFESDQVDVAERMDKLFTDTDCQENATKTSRITLNYFIENQNPLRIREKTWWPRHDSNMRSSV